MKYKTNFDKVYEFHNAFNADIDRDFSEDRINLRINLMKEELEEVLSELYEEGSHITIRTMKDINRVKLTKELADLLYVVYGTAVAFGLPIEEVFNEVHRSNMSKLGLDGKPIYRDDGKVLKGPKYEEPQLDLIALAEGIGNV